MKNQNKVLVFQNYIFLKKNCNKWKWKGWGGGEWIGMLDSFEAVQRKILNASN